MLYCLVQVGALQTRRDKGILEYHFSFLNSIVDNVKAQKGDCGVDWLPPRHERGNRIYWKMRAWVKEMEKELFVQAAVEEAK